MGSCKWMKLHEVNLAWLGSASGMKGRAWVSLHEATCVQGWEKQWAG